MPRSVTRIGRKRNPELQTDPQKIINFSRLRSIIRDPRMECFSPATLKNAPRGHTSKPQTDSLRRTMLKDLQLKVCSAAIASASLSQPGALGYGAAISIAVGLLHATVRTIWQWVRQLARDGNRPQRRSTRGAGRNGAITARPWLLPAGFNMAPASKAPGRRERYHAQG
jgi:hypothetical protein